MSDERIEPGRGLRPRLGSILLGKYRVESALPPGGVGVAYHAWDLRLDERVCLKILDLPSGPGHAEVARRVRSQARAQLELRHDAIMELRDFGELEDGTPALVTEAFVGDTLQTLMGRGERFTPAEVETILRQSLEALAHAHGRGVLHRDFTPASLVIQRGDTLRVKVQDVGLTRLVADEGSAFTVAGEVFGSPRFMAPEQWYQQPIDGRTDLYALGLIGYCLVLGAHFIERDNPVKVCDAHLHTKRPDLEAVEGVSEDLARSLERAARPQIEERHPNAGEMLAALDGGETTAPVAAPTSADVDTWPEGGPAILESGWNQAVLDLDETLFSGGADATAVEVRTPLEPMLPDETVEAPSEEPAPAVVERTPTPHAPRDQLLQMRGEDVERALRQAPDMERFRPTAELPRPKKHGAAQGFTPSPPTKGVPPWVYSIASAVLTAALVWLLMR